MFCDDSIIIFLVHTDLLSSPENGLCLRCHYVHNQHFPDLKIVNYMTSPSPPDSQHPPSPSPSPRRCSFCSEPFQGHSAALTRPLPSGLASLREACAFREPQTELECSLASQWITGTLYQTCNHSFYCHDMQLYRWF